MKGRLVSVDMEDMEDRFVSAGTEDRFGSGAADDDRIFVSAIEWGRLLRR
jgi:hypothetical protein